MWLKPETQMMTNQLRRVQKRPKHLPAQDNITDSENPADKQQAHQTTPESKPSQDSRSYPQGRRQATIGQPVGNPPATNVCQCSDSGNTESTKQKISLHGW